MFILNAQMYSAAVAGLINNNAYIKVIVIIKKKSYFKLKNALEI